MLSKGFFHCVYSANSSITTEVTLIRNTCHALKYTESLFFFEDDASTSIDGNPCWVNKELTHCVYYLVPELVVNTISNSVMFAFHKNQTNVRYCFKIHFACVYVFHQGCDKFMHGGRMHDKKII